MADNKKAPAKPSPPAKPKKSRFLLKFFLLIFLLLILAGGSFAAGVYLKFIDIPKLAGQLNLYNYPVIGQVLNQYYPRQATNFETVELPPETEPEQPPPVQQVEVQPAANPQPSDADKEKAAAAAKLDEAKRISRLARLYGEMKPDEAVPIMNKLDDATVLSIMGKMDDSQVAKILALFDPKRSASLTEQMLKGNKKTL